MNRQWLVPSLALAAFIVLGGYFLVQWFFSLPGAANHDQYVQDTTTVRMVLQPSRVQGYVSDLAPQATKLVDAIPKFTSTQNRAYRIDWIHKLPHEITFLFSRVSRDRLEVLLYVNELPEADSFSREVNNSGFWGRARGIYWDNPRLTAQGLSERLARGGMFVPEYADEMISATLTNPQRSIPPPIDGRHLFEFAADNREGGLMEWQAAMRDAWGDWLGRDFQDELAAALGGVVYLQVTGDLRTDDELEFNVHIELRDPAMSAPVGTTLGNFIDEMDTFLASAIGARAIPTTIDTIGDTVAGGFTVTGFEPRVRRALGN